MSEETKNGTVVETQDKPNENVGEPITATLTEEEVNTNISKVVDNTISKVKKTRKKGIKKLELTKSVFSTTERNDGWLIETNQRRFIKKLQRFGVRYEPIEGSKGAVSAIVPFKWVSIRKSRSGMSPQAAAKINLQRDAKRAAKADSSHDQTTSKASV